MGAAGVSMNSNSSEASEWVLDMIVHLEYNAGGVLLREGVSHAAVKKVCLKIGCRWGLELEAWTRLHVLTFSLPIHQQQLRQHLHYNIVLQSDGSRVSHTASIARRKRLNDAESFSLVFV